LKTLRQGEGFRVASESKETQLPHPALAGFKIDPTYINCKTHEVLAPLLEDSNDASRPSTIDNGLRHSGLTYHLRLTNHDGETTLWGGNSPKMIHESVQRSQRPSSKLGTIGRSFPMVRIAKLFVPTSGGANFTAAAMPAAEEKPVALASVWLVSSP
tara:strand:- start:795 stop:1265 length:471 start_codon:yes stop_codon:yes gene_type:complete